MTITAAETPGAQTPANEETVTVTETTVACDGTADAGGHPRVFLKIDAASRDAQCPYCSRVFKLDPSVSAGGH